MFMQRRAFEYFRGDDRHRVVRSLPEFNEAITWLGKHDIIAFDTETSGLDWHQHASICGVAAGAMDESGQARAFYFPVRHQTGEVQLPENHVFAGVRSLLEDPSKQTIWHNKKFDQHMFNREGISIRGPFRDTMIEAYLWDENSPLALKDRTALDLQHHAAHEFEGVLRRAVARLSKASKCKISEYKDLFGYARVSVPLAGVYACYDIEFTLRLAAYYDAKGVTSFFRKIYDMELELTNVICDMEEAGLPINKDYLQWLAGETDDAMQQLIPKLQAEAGKEFSPSSDAEVIDVLTQKFGVTLWKETKSSKRRRWKAREAEEVHTPTFAVDADVLTDLPGVYPATAAFCKALLEYREAAKIRGTYTTSLLDRVGRDGNLHGEFKQIGTNTGRMSAEKPNLQNISQDSQERALKFSGKKLKDGGQDPWSIKRAFICRSPEEIRVFNDYSQIELRVLAHLSKDPMLLKTYQTPGADVHTMTSLEVFGSADEEFRRNAKIINFGLSYMLGAAAYAKQAGVSIEQGERDMERFFKRLARIEPFRKEVWDAARAQSTVPGVPPHFINMFGRPRRVPMLNARDKFVRLRAERQCFGSLVQGTAAELTKESLIRIWRWEKKARSGMKLCLVIHDDIAFDVHKDVAHDVMRAVVPMMESYPQFDDVPILIDSVFSDTDWSEKKKFPKGVVHHVWDPANHL